MRPSLYHFYRISISIVTVFIIVAVGGYLYTVTASGRDTITVTSIDNSGTGSLRQAIADASSGDLIAFDATLAGQTIALTTGPLIIDKSLIIESDIANPMKVSGSNQSTVMEIASGTDVTLRNLIVKDGLESTCAGINSSGMLQLDGVTVIDNRASFFGGGLCVFGAGVTIDNSRFINNQVSSVFRDGMRGSSNGGAIFASANSIIIKNSEFMGNEAGAGGISDLYQVHSSDASDSAIGKIEISNSTFDGSVLNGPFSTKPASSLKIENTTFDGGELMNGGQMTATKLTVRNGAGFSNTWADGSAKISDSLFENNTSWNGGGIENGGILELSNSAIVSNTATNRGGGISNYGVMTLTNVTISGNQGGAPFDGASAIHQETVFSVFSYPQPLTYLNNVTIAGNGGASPNVLSADLHNRIQFRNTIIADNSNANNCSQPSGQSAGQSLGNSLSDDMTCSMNNASDISNAGNALLSALSYGGADTPTHALTSGSGAIDAGDPATCAAFDQRGFSRPVDGNSDDIAICDMGAYEYLAMPLMLNEKVYLPIVIR